MNIKRELFKKYPQIMAVDQTNKCDGRDYFIFFKNKHDRDLFLSDWRKYGNHGVMDQVTDNGIPYLKILSYWVEDFLEERHVVKVNIEQIRRATNG